MTVIGYADELAATGFYFDAYASGAGIESVLEEFFDNRGGTIDHFAGSDLIGHLVGKNTNASHEMRVAGMILWKGAGVRD